MAGGGKNTPNGVGRPYDPPQRSKALPKHTLFGAELEHFSEEDKQAMRQLDLQKLQADQEQARLAQQQRYKPTLPSHMKEMLPRSSAARRKQQVQQQLQQANAEQQNYNAAEDSAKYFQTPSGSSKKQSSTSKSVRYTDNDLHHAGEINSVGITPGKSSFNRDKYESSKPSHQYSGIGDPLKLGMDFDENAPAVYVPGPGEPYKRHRAPDWKSPTEFIQEPKSDPKLAIDVPANIRHQFGTKVCQEVLGDKSKVDDSLERQRQIKSQNARKEREAPDLQLSPSNSEYQSLSHSVRQNIFPGYSVHGKASIMRNDYSQEVYDKRVPESDEYKQKKHALSAWVDQNIRRERTRKEWDKIDAEKAKPAAH